MSLSHEDIIHILLALLAILMAAHAMGFLFQKFKQPPVIGEILGGMFLGPTVLGFFLPHVTHYLFFENTATQVLLASLSQLGLIFLMFSSGLEIRSLFRLSETKTSIFIAVVGSVIPFLAAILCSYWIDFSFLYGPAQNQTAFLLIFASAVAVTSIPVISRIFVDLGIIQTPFARIVLSAAVFEDIALYTVIGVALAMVSTSAGIGFWNTPGGGPHLMWEMGSHVVMHVFYFVFFALVGARFFATVGNSRFNFLSQKSPVGFLLVSLFLITLCAVFLGISPMFGAFAAGMMVGASGERFESAGEIIRKNAFSFSIPIYFAIIGIKLNMIQNLNILFFILFLGAACAVKALSVYLGARMAKETHKGSWNFAVSMNARGGPGIVLASVAHEAKIINDEFYTVLILLAILSSLGAGIWLERVVRKGEALR